MTPSGDLLAGQIGKPHGLAGEVHVVPISDDPRRFDAGSRLKHAGGRQLVVESSRSHSGRLLVKFEGVTTRDEAEGLRGALFVSAADVRPLQDDEYWPQDISGCDVVLVDGTVAGRVERIVPGAAQDLLVVETSRGERMIPFVKEIVVEVDVGARRIRVDPPAGLLD